jgi:Wax ester synthase-like Acyl-CoA acyltransferase domain
MSQTLDRMSTLDAEFFYAEHHNVPMHIGSVAVFEGPAPTRADLMRLFEAKLPRVPRYRQGDLPQRPDRPAPPVDLDHREPRRPEADPCGARRHDQRRRARRGHRSLPRPA